MVGNRCKQAGWETRAPNLTHGGSPASGGQTNPDLSKGPCCSASAEASLPPPFLSNLHLEAPLIEEGGSGRTQAPRMLQFKPTDFLQSAQY